MNSRIEISDGGEHLAAFRELAAEYGLSIADVAACSLEHQGFEDELRGLPGRYAPSCGGRMLIAMVDGQPAGCIALRALPEVGVGVCEMKRMYVRPACRGLKLGRLLAERLIDEARTIGYTVMKLDTDTAPKFAAAIGLYRSLGFVECERYNADPDPKTLWFELRL
jgi:GNAT superfamily N-acetyltransferase